MIRLGIRPAEARAKALGLRKLKPFVSGSVFLTKNAIKDTLVEKLLREDPNIDTALKIIDLLILQIEELERERAWLQSLHDEIQLEIQKLKIEYFSLESEESEIGDNE
ncbi:Oidioi.mRNA.OKI2018_I69.chr2.g7539.t1.cds [Oikopleura dioica]|uniref:Oidioi.mRNA.OKI2018_I69.chr2.g7539.t1.cds n=1 Tax=Oikopleura dioica TaxID=34765 RepID=A0ABN7TCY5_OIKDI|nr:Oidioi.mRNA.OKI2018_I69.chr2.g7539.t1.cds [Oikopleura dioica]